MRVCLASEVQRLASDGGLAQLVEHLLCKQGVIGSNPIVSRPTNLMSDV